MAETDLLIITTPDGERYLTYRQPQKVTLGGWRVSGKRWIKSREAWAKTGVSRLYDIDLSEFIIEKATK